MQFDTLLHDHQPEAAAGRVANIASSMERLEKLSRVGFGNSDAPIAHSKHRKIPASLNRELEWSFWSGILHSVDEQIGEDVTKQSFIPPRFGQAGRNVQLNRTALICR